MNVEHSSARVLEHFRAPKRRLPLHPLEKAVLAAVAVHLCFLPWALGTMHPWSQVTSLVMASIGLLLALIPRTYSGDYLPVSGLQFTVDRPKTAPPVINSPPSTVSPSSVHRHSPSVFRLNPVPRLLRFPIFWIGLALLGYIALQASNPSWVWERNATTWWLRRVNDIPWLPTSIDTPWERFNIWRQFIIYASAWLTVCTVWTGFTRRKSLEILLWCIALNGLVVTTAGFVARMLRPPHFLLWFKEPMQGVISFSSFIYKNHAGAWLSLVAAVLVVLAAIVHQRGERTIARSSPAVLLLLGAIMVFFGVGFTYSRGATVLLAVFFAVSGVACLLFRLFSGSKSTTHFLVPVSISVLVLLVVGYAASQLNYQTIERRFERLFQENTKDISLLYREQAHLASGEMFGDYWRRGVGAGGFRFLYPEYIKKHPDVYKGGRMFWEHAHNDWLQIPIELGVAGSLFLLMSAAWILTSLFRSSAWKNLPALLLCFGLGQTLLHATFDFPFQNPAILCTWLALLLLAIRWLELEGARDRSRIVA